MFRRIIPLLTLALLSATVETFAFNVKLAEPETDSGFTMSVSPTSQMVTPGEDASYTINLTGHQHTPSVSLNVSGEPPGLTHSFVPSSVSPNGTSTLKLTVSSSTPGGSYSLAINASRGNVTHTSNVFLVVATLMGSVVQTKTGTITFSWSKTLEEGTSFSLTGTTVTIHAKADISLTMPLSIDANSNETITKAGSGTWVVVSASSGSAQIGLTLKATGSIGSASQSTTQTWTRSFSTPLGASSDIIFPTLSIPAIDAVIGKVTIDLTPKASLVGFANGNLSVEGPASLNKQSLHWDASGTKKTILAMLSEEKEVQVFIVSPVLTITQMMVGTNIGATLKPIIGSPIPFNNIGSIQFPIQTDTELAGSPNSVVIAKYSLPSPLSPLSPPPVPQTASSPFNPYWILVGIGAIGAVATGVTGISLRKRRRHKLVPNASLLKSTNTLAQIQPKRSETEFALISDDYSTGALCYVDNYPLGGDARVLKCPRCNALFHEDCLLSVLELRSRCPKCGNPLFF